MQINNPKSVNWRRLQTQWVNSMLFTSCMYLFTASMHMQITPKGILVNLIYTAKAMKLLANDFKAFAMLKMQLLLFDYFLQI